MRICAFKVPYEGFGLHVEACWTGREQGGDARYVLFLHGGGPATSSEGTRYLRDDLAARGLASVAMDFSGHGRSGGCLQDASLRLRCEEAFRVVDSMSARPRAIVATSMAGHVACRLSERLQLDALVLFCPAAYETAAEEARFGEEFRSVIRATRRFEDSPAFEALRRFEGRVLGFYGTQDDVIPAQVQHCYAPAAGRAPGREFAWLDDAGHRLHDWISERPAVRMHVVDRLLTALS